MKRIICMMTAILIVMSFAGCGAKEPASSTETTEYTTEAAIPLETPLETTAETEVPVPSVTEEMDRTEPVQTEAAPTESTAPKCEHEYRFKTLKFPTCTSSGIRKYTCTKCGDSYMKNLDPLDHAFVITRAEPDCVNTGSTTYHCKECGYTYTDQIQPALGHDFGPLVTIRNPTELLPGMAEHSCLRCGKTEQVELPRLVPAP